MSRDSDEEFVTAAIRHAKEYWYLDDDAVVREWCERRTEADTPETLVDETAVRYGLIHSTDKTGAVRAAKQLLDEYKDEFGNLREVLLARLPS
jgi:hypothetical protein